MAGLMTHAAKGSADAVGQEVTQAVFKTPQGAAALVSAANAIVRIGAAVAGVGTAAVAGGKAIAAIVAPAVTIWALMIIYGYVYRWFLDFLKDT